MQSGKATTKMSPKPFTRSMRQVAISLHNFDSLFSLHAEPKLDPPVAKKLRLMLDRLLNEVDTRAEVWR